MHWHLAAERREEEVVARRLRASSKFYKFLWEIRGELFDEAFEKQLIECHAPRGQAPCAPAMLAMVMLLQRYDGVGNADAVDAAENDRCWQLVLGTLGSTAAPFAQGSLVRCRTRMIARPRQATRREDCRVGEADEEVRLAATARGARLLSSRWCWAGGRHVESHRPGDVDVDEAEVIRAARLKALTEDSVKASLDVAKRAKPHAAKSPLKEAIALLHHVVGQDTEPGGGGGVRITQDVARERVISISDTQMRHGRKSRSVRIDGYKRHIAVANGFVLATVVEPRTHESTSQPRGSSPKPRPTANSRPSTSTAGTSPAPPSCGFIARASSSIHGRGPSPPTASSPKRTSSSTSPPNR